jgi:acetyltransferase-like isoleucine patch superfamily enzyme
MGNFVVQGLASLTFGLMRWALKHRRRSVENLHNRHVPAGDLVFDRWETAKSYGFGEGTSCYDNVVIIGDVTIGENTWIGPNVVLDGSGGLRIGSFVSISAGSQIYTHNTLDWAGSHGALEVVRAPTEIGDGVYVGPNSVISMGVTIGDQAVIGAMSFVNSDIPPGSKAFGVPARAVDAGLDDT